VRQPRQQTGKSPTHSGRSASGSFKPRARIADSASVAQARRGNRQPERRSAARTATSGIRVEFHAAGLSGSGTLRNLTERGLFIASADLPARGSAVTIRFTTPDKRRVEVAGRVGWIRESGPDQGFGVALAGVDSEYGAFIGRLLRG
jgi:hypothetical protein